MNKENRTPSLDYSSFPTLAPLPAQSRANLIRCEQCGGAEFLLLQPDRAAVCKKCGRAVSGPNTPINKTTRKRLLPKICYPYILLPNGGVKNIDLIANVLEEVYGWYGITDITGDSIKLAGLRADGTVVIAEKRNDYQFIRNATQNWHGISAIDGDATIVGLFADGTVRAVGNNLSGECNVQNWTNIIAIATGSYHTVGLCGDGTVRAVGSNDEGQCDVSHWKDIIAISANHKHTVALCRDGTVHAAGDNRYGQCNTHGWSEITAIATGSGYTVGLRKDGTVQAVGDHRYGMCDVQGWSDVVEISTARCATIGLRRDGTILCTDPKLLAQINEALA